MFSDSVRAPSYLPNIGVPFLDEDSKKKCSGISVFVINLDKDIHRYHDILPLVQTLGFPFSRVSGVIGKTLSKSFVEKFVDKHGYKLAFNGATPGAGELGCFLSHVKVWALFLNSNSEFALILEDDATFDPVNLESVLKELIKFRHQWDICSLFLPPRFSGSFFCIKKFSFSQSIVRFLTETSGTVGMLVNRNAARALLSKAQRYVLPVDHYVQRTWEFGNSLQFAGLVPGLVTEKEGDSAIELQGRRERAKKTFCFNQLQRIRSQIFHLKSSIVYYMYNVYLTLMGKFRS
ncbi:glycosyltransferase family 25 protein [Holospora obtusa]|uniref:glycosyltransferase family 25 protein n=1 Tax=Holospora obtusa TaxID=49893 RepID=UPI00138ADC23|nr:glycosyltransferase family 25 protein [Holospora obtusa]